MAVMEQQSAITLAAVKNVLFATDFSEASEAALPYVAAFSACYGSQIHLTHVLPEVTFLRPGVPDPAAIGFTYEDVHSGLIKRCGVWREGSRTTRTARTFATARYLE